MITWDDYMKGRDKEFASELTPEIRANAERTIICINAGLLMYYTDLPSAPHPVLTSGWRPVSVNIAAGGAAHSCHMVAEAGDLSETENRILSLWSMRNKERLKAVGIMAMERPEATAKYSGGKLVYWTHWQTKSPGSGVFAYWPSVAAMNAWKESGKPLMVG